MLQGCMHVTVTMDHNSSCLRHPLFTRLKFQSQGKAFLKLNYYCMFARSKQKPISMFEYLLKIIVTGYI
jgi:hypothetical protein